MADTSAAPPNNPTRDDEASLRQRLQAQPRDVDALAELAVVRAAAGHFEEGLDLAQQAIALRGDDPRLRLSAGGMAGNAGDFDMAARHYREALALQADSADAHVGLGQVAEMRDQPSAAAEHYVAALRTQPNNADAQLGTARLAMLSGHAERAVQLFAKVVQDDPDNPRALTGYGQALMQRGTPEHAARPLRKALKLAPDSLPTRLMLAHVELYRGQIQEAEARYREVLEVEPSNGDALAGLGDTLRAQKRLDEAWQVYDAARRRHPEAEVLTSMRNTCLAALNRSAEALEDLRAYVLEYPRCEGPRLLLAEILRSDNRVADVEAMWQKAVDADPEDALAQAELAPFHEGRGEFDKAAAAAARSGADTRSAACLMRARLALRSHNLEEAERQLRQLKGLKLEDMEKRARLRLLGLTHDGAERWAEAALAFREAQRVEAEPLPQLLSREQLEPVIEPLLEQPPLQHPRVEPPVLLLGLPGSSVDRVAALLADQPGVAVRNDRRAGQSDFFADADEGSLLVPLEQSRLGVQARRYARVQQRVVSGEPDCVVDWLPLLDARLLPVTKLALPGVRVVIVDADLELAYLRWLALGWQAAFRMPDSRRAAVWLRLAAEQLDLAASHLPGLRVDGERLLDDPQAHGSDLAHFLGLEQLVPGPRTAVAERGMTGLGEQFVAGHQAHYRDVLGEAFAELR